MNYLIVEGYRDAAANFLDESGTEPKVDLRTIEERVAIRKVCAQCIMWACVIGVGYRIESVDAWISNFRCVVSKVSIDRNVELLTRCMYHVKRTPSIPGNPRIFVCADAGRNLSTYFCIDYCMEMMWIRCVACRYGIQLVSFDIYHWHGVYTATSRYVQGCC